MQNHFARDFVGLSNAISLDNQLNIIQVADLVLPDKDTTFEEYTTIELLSVSMMIVISTFALDFIHSNRSIFKIVDLDEAWAFLNVAQGETLSTSEYLILIVNTIDWFPDIHIIIISVIQRTDLDVYKRQFHPSLAMMFS